MINHGLYAFALIGGSSDHTTAACNYCGFWDAHGSKSGKSIAVNSTIEFHEDGCTTMHRLHALNT